MKTKVKIRYKNGSRTNGWTAERRRAQSKQIKRWKPWLKSTGPRTKEGKAIVAKNAYKHGFRSASMKEIYRLLRWQKDFVKNIETQIKLNPYKKLISPASYDQELAWLIPYNVV